MHRRFSEFWAGRNRVDVFGLQLPLISALAPTTLLWKLTAIRFGKKEG
jgi:hypothetical protein